MQKINVEDLYINKRILAPLVGGSDLSFRLLCRKYGAEITFTEMCIAEYWLAKLQGTHKKLKDYTYEFDKLDRPLILQVAGTDPDQIIEMINNPFFEGHIDGVDLNCGCPQGFAQEKGIGCYALKDPVKLVELVTKVSKNITYPLSVKMRFHENIQTTIDIIEKLSHAGVIAFTVHGRYFWQKNQNRGLCDWDSIRTIREALPNITLIGNGDVSCYNDFNVYKERGNVDSVMVGYGALLDPTVFTNQTIPIQEVVMDYLKIAYTKHNKLISVLKHLEWILRRSHSSVNFKSELFCCEDLESIAEKLKTLDPPIFIDLDIFHGLDCHIQFPKKVGEMNMKQLKKLKKRKMKMESRKVKKMKHSNLNDLERE